MLFLDDKHQLRAGWKFALYCAFFVILLFAAQVGVSFFLTRTTIDFENPLILLGVNQIIMIPAVGAILLTIRFADHRPLRTFGIGFIPSWRRDLLCGLLLAAGMLAIVIAGCYGIAYVSMHWTATQVPARVLLATFGLLVVAALNEELIFRGFPLQLLMESIGEWPAIIGLSGVFGALHLRNPNASFLGGVNTAVAGILLSLAYARTRSLWFPYAIHVGWNVGLGFVFCFPLSGIDLASLWTTGTAGSETIVGGSYGPEGGLLATFVFASAAVLVERRKVKEP